MTAGGLVILVTGSRDWPERFGFVIAQHLDNALATAKRAAQYPPVLMHGGCTHPDAPDGPYVGADGIAHRHWLALVGAVAGPTRELLSPSPVVYPAQWAAYGRGAGPKRNAEMVRHLAAHVAAGGTGMVLGFPWGASPGTRGCLKLAAEAGLPVTVVEGADAIGRKPTGAAGPTRSARRVWGRS